MSEIKSNLLEPLNGSDGSDRRQDQQTVVHKNPDKKKADRGAVSIAAVAIFLLAVGVLIVAFAVASVGKIEVQSCLDHCGHTNESSSSPQPNPPPFYPLPDLPEAVVNGTDACQAYITLSNVSRESTTAYAAIATVAAITAPVGALSLLGNKQSTKMYLKFLGAAGAAQVVNAVLATIQLLAPILAMKSFNDEPCLDKDNAGMDASTLKTLGNVSLAFLCTGIVLLISAFLKRRFRMQKVTCQRCIKLDAEYQCESTCLKSCYHDKPRVCHPCCKFICCAFGCLSLNRSKTTLVLRLPRIRVLLWVFALFLVAVGIIIGTLDATAASNTSPTECILTCWQPANIGRCCSGKNTNSTSELIGCLGADRCLLFEEYENLSSGAWVAHISVALVALMLAPVLSQKLSDTSESTNAAARDLSSPSAESQHDGTGLADSNSSAEEGSGLVKAIKKLLKEYSNIVEAVPQLAGMANGISAAYLLVLPMIKLNSDHTCCFKYQDDIMRMYHTAIVALTFIFTGLVLALSIQLGAFIYDRYKPAATK